MKALRNLSVIFATALVSANAFAQDASAHAVPTAVGGSFGLVGLGLGLMMGLAVLGGTLGQGKAVSMALESTGRNPAASGKMNLFFFVGLALIESLVLFALLIGFQLAGAITEVLKIVK